MDLRINQGIKVSRSSRPTRYFEDHLPPLICKDFGNLMKICFFNPLICKSRLYAKKVLEISYLNHFVPKSRNFVPKKMFSIHLLL